MKLDKRSQVYNFSVDNNQNYFVGEAGVLVHNSAGKDLSKGDRSSAYACRYIAKNIVAAGLADECEVQLSYAIGVAKPTSIYIDTRGTANKDLSIEDFKLAEMVDQIFPVTPYQIRKWITDAGVDFNVVRKESAYGNDKFPWEQLDKVDAVRDYFKL